MTMLVLSPSNSLAFGAQRLQRPFTNTNIATNRVPSHTSSSTSTSLRDSYDDGVEPFLLEDLKLRSPTPSLATTLRDNHSHKEKDYNGSNNNVNHRYSANDWLHNVGSLPKSTVLRDIKSPVLSISIWATMVGLFHKVALSSSSSSSLLATMARNMCVGPQVHSFLVSSLGLLLVFRTNSAYQRFTEGRKIWEQILSTSRNLTRLLNIYEQDLSPTLSKRVKHLLASFPYLLRHHIRPRCLRCKNDIPFEYRLHLKETQYEFVETRHEGDKSYGGRTDPTMMMVMNDNNTQEQQQERHGENKHCCWVDTRAFPWSLLPDRQTLLNCGNARNRPLWVCDRMAKEIATIPTNANSSWTSRERLTMISQVDKLSNAIGECERIHQTAVPLNYARHALRSLTLWLVTLPFALVKDHGLLTGPICGITAWLMFGVYQIGHSIEDPFQSALRLSILCNAIRSDVLDETDSNSSAFDSSSSGSLGESRLSSMNHSELTI